MFRYSERNEIRRAPIKFITYIRIFITFLIKKKIFNTFIAPKISVNEIFPNFDQSEKKYLNQSLF